MSDPRPGTDPLPPFSIQAEEAVVASLLVDEEALVKVQGILRPQDFYREQNRWAYEACMALAERGEGINQITVAHELTRRQRLEEVGGVSFLSRLVTELPTPIGAEHYARIVRRDATYRQLITQTAELTKIAYGGDGDLGRVLADAEGRMAALREQAQPILGAGSRIPVLEGEALSEPVGEAPHVIEDTYPAAGLTVVAGPGESWKTWVQLEASQAVAAGTGFLDRFRVQQGPAIYFDQQVGEHEAKRRAQKLAVGRDRDLPSLPFYVSVDAGLNLANAADLAAVRELIMERQAVLVTFDALGDFFRGININSPQDMGEAARTLRDIALATGAAVVAVHHWRKSSKEGPNTPEERLLGGWTLRDTADSYLALQRYGENQVLVTHAKARRAPRIAPFLVTVDGGRDDDFVRLRYTADAGESVGVQDQAAGWLLQLLAQRGPMPKPDIIDAAANEGVAGPRSIENALGRLMGSGSLGRGRRPGDRRVHYWLDAEPPGWASEEAML